MLPLTRHDRAIQIAGEPDLTDYHSPLGPDPHLLGPALAALLADGHRLVLDSLPERSARSLAEGLSESGVDAEPGPDTTAAVLRLAGDGSHLDRLDKKQRHEIRRKRRRYEAALGEIVVATGSGDAAFARFAELHRSTPGRKGDFLVGSRLSFFQDLAGQPGWRVDELRSGDRAVAALFGYLDEDGYYLYNSAYDPAMREMSPGIVLLTEVIAIMSTRGVPRFDFLKGDEDYKFRLGAEPRQLYRIDVG